MAKNMDTIHTGDSYGDVNIDYYSKEEVGGATVYYDDQSRVVAVAEEMHGEYRLDGGYESFDSGNYELTVYSYDGDGCSHVTHYEDSKITEYDFEKHADGHISAHVEMTDTNPEFWEPSSEDKDVHYVVDPETEHYVEMTPEQYETYQDTGIIDGRDVSADAVVTEEVLDGIAGDRDFPIVDVDISVDARDENPIERNGEEQVGHIDMYSREPGESDLSRVDVTFEYDRAVETDRTISYYDSDNNLVATKEDISDNADGSRMRVTLYESYETAEGETIETKTVYEDRNGVLESVEITEREQGTNEDGEPYVRETVQEYAYRDGVEQGTNECETLYEYNPDSGDVIITREGDIGDAAPFEVVSPDGANYRELCENIGVDNIEHENVDRREDDLTEREPRGDLPDGEMPDGTEPPDETEPNEETEPSGDFWDGWDDGSD